jgi:IS30 family transposase
MLQVRAKKKDIAKVLNKHRSTIWRELNRNKAHNKSGYSARLSKIKTTERRINANKRFRKIDDNKWLQEYIIKKIKEKWSPEQISGRLKIDYPDESKKRIGKDSIYKFIYNERKDLVKHLRCQKGKYRRRYGTRIREKERERLKKKRIDVRPEIVDKRERIGDWEGDTIVGKEKTIHILTHVDRKSGILFADKLEQATAEITKQKTIERFNKIPKNKKNTITYDNGTTFSYFEMTEKKTGMDIYFAWPYHSWERGCNENANGLLRQFFPKKSSFAIVTQDEINKAVKLINNRPRKRLNYKTPAEVFRQN